MPFSEYICTNMYVCVQSQTAVLRHRAGPAGKGQGRTVTSKDRKDLGKLGEECKENFRDVKIREGERMRKTGRGCVRETGGGGEMLELHGYCRLWAEEDPNLTMLIK